MATDESKKGFCNKNGDDLARLIVGITKTEAVDVSAGDVIPTMTNCRGISVDADGIVKFNYIDDFGEETTTEVKVMKAGAMYPYRNVTKVFKIYVGSTDVTAKVYSAAGSLVIGLKLHR